MKTIKLVIFVLLALALPLVPMESKAVLIGSGDTVRFDFTMSSEDSLALPYNALALGLIFGTNPDPLNPTGNLWDDGESFRLRAFNAIGTEFSNNVFTNDFGVSIYEAYFNFPSPLVLNTASGYVLMSDINGSFDFIENLAVVQGYNVLKLSWVAFDTTVSVNNTPVNPVPEPSTMLLLGSGLIGLWGARKKFKK